MKKQIVVTVVVLVVIVGLMLTVHLLVNRFDSGRRRENDAWRLTPISGATGHTGKNRLCGGRRWTARPHRRCRRHLAWRHSDASGSPTLASTARS